MRSLIAFISSIILVLLTQTAFGQNIEVLISEIQPLAFTTNALPTGFCVDIAQEIQHRTGSHFKINSVPWPRAYKRGLKEENLILLCPKRTADRESLFKWVGPVLESHTVLFKKKDSPLKIQSLSDAKKVPSILVPREFYSYALLLNLGFKNLFGVNDSITGLRMLLGGRGSLFALDQQQISSLLSELKVPPSSVEPAYSIGEANSYFIFSKNIPDELVVKWQKSLNSIKSDGTYHRIYKKWFSKK